MPSTAVLAPLSGKIGSIKVTEGQYVNAGAIVIVQLSNKTETSVTAPVSGRIKLSVQLGAQVNQGDSLAEIEA